MRKIVLTTAMLLALSATAWGRNEEERVTKVSEERSLITPVDLVITDKDCRCLHTVFLPPFPAVQSV